MRIFVLALGLFLAACSGPKTEAPRSGPWMLSGAESHLTFMTIKNGSVVEAHSFGSMTGIADHSVLIDIDLNTVETGIDIRNERMREHLFETGQTPELQIETLITLEDFATLELGETRQVEKPVSVKMHGVDQSYDIEILVTRLNVNKVMAQSKTPIIVDASEFGMETGVEKLRELANLTSITMSVPVSFSLVFER